MALKPSPSSHLPADPIVSHPNSPEFAARWADAMGIAPDTLCKCGHRFDQHITGATSMCALDECTCLSFRRAV